MTMATRLEEVGGEKLCRDCLGREKEAKP
jgi:hypothetical protein